MQKPCNVETTHSEQTNQTKRIKAEAVKYKKNINGFF